LYNQTVYAYVLYYTAFLRLKSPSTPATTTRSCSGCWPTGIRLFLTLGLHLLLDGEEFANASINADGFTLVELGFVVTLGDTFGDAGLYYSTEKSLLVYDGCFRRKCFNAM
jgi:hypothetical protein